MRPTSLCADRSLLLSGVAAVLAALTAPIMPVAAIAAETAVASEAPAESLAVLFDDYWAFELREDPFAATSAGAYEHNDKVPAVAPADYARRLDARKAFLARLQAVDVSAAPPQDQLSAELLGFILKHEIALGPYASWRAPILSDSGFHMQMGYVVGSTPFRARADYDAYLARLAALPAYIDQNLVNMRQGLADGFTQPKEILPQILPSFEAQATPAPTEHPLYEPFRDMPAGLSADVKAALRAAAVKTLEESVIPAFARAHAFMKDEYAPAATDKTGAVHLPSGSDYYAALVRYYTTLDDATPEAIHQIGLREVARIRKEMDGVIKETGFSGSFAEFIEFLRTDRQFYAETPDDLLKEAAAISKDIDGRLPKYFGKLPRQPYSVEPVPAAIASNYTTGRYVPAPPDGDRGGQYWVNTYALDKRPLYQLTALSLHEAVPGHHLQGALSYEIEGAPEFRTQFYPHAFGEGWGLYAEKLGVEMGVYRTPYEHFGRLSYEMWRACRLVIDTGLHAKGWTRAQAMDYLASNTALSLHNVQTEVDRYISWPGQALAYKMGELTIWELRRKAERELGERFDIRAFHDAILAEGGLPLEILRRRIETYIADAKAAGAAAAK